MLALLGPAVVAQSWQISQIVANNQGPWLLLTQPFRLRGGLDRLMGKLEMRLRRAQGSHGNCRGALTEYSGRGLGLFHLGKEMELWSLDADRRPVHGRHRQPARILRQDAAARGDPHSVHAV